MDGNLYILDCADGSYYTGSTNDLDMRFQQHFNGIAANHTKKRVPVKEEIKPTKNFNTQ
jgi:predicted GIY-YIG superfamily endonuclease